MIADRTDALLPWSKRTERDVVVHGRHSTRFYWFAQRRMTNEVAYHKLRQNRAPFHRQAIAFAKTKVAQMGMALTRNERS